MGGEAQRRLAALPFFGTAKVVALYAAQSFEPSTDVLQQALLARGATVCLPRIVKHEQRLEFHQVTGSPLVLGRYPVLEPAVTEPVVSIAAVDLWVVPGLSFTTAGARLGRGGGYYDRVLALARADAFKVGLTFECMIEPSLPLEAHDRGVDAVVTERATYWVRSANTHE